ncbi:signal transduction histidine kinase [Streptacidiphilus sp. MAP12-16]|uniref:sensor histidine kinase n=1 Tax=Streptacidiphilus sp. MAP12-16 TaxID=3156300 RepID=UPI00351320F5
MTGVTRSSIVNDPRTPAIAGAVLAALAMGEAITRGATSDASAQQTTVYGLLALATALPLALLRPTAAAVATNAAAVLSLSLFHTLTIAGACAVSLTLYQLGRSLRLALVLCAPYVVLALAGPRPSSSEAAFLTASLAALAPAAALTGAARRAQNEARLHIAAREAVAGTLIEHTARGERARIARELHDVVAHHISMVAVQAETARLTTPGLPAAGAQRLSAIGDTARDALTEMRRLLGVLREDTGPAAADLRPQPGLAQLIDLLDESREASGAETRLIFRGTPAPLDPGVELAAYRIVQEALTNTRRHAPGSAVDVEIHFTDDALHLRVRDNGPGTGTADAPTGHGLLGMRERATAVGGALRTGAAPGTGFLVEAHLPTKTEAGR